MTLSYVYTEGQCHGGAGRSKQGDRLSRSMFRGEGRGCPVWLHTHHPPSAAPLAVQLVPRDPRCNQVEASHSPRTRLHTRQEQSCSCLVQSQWPLTAHQPSPLCSCSDNHAPEHPAHENWALPCSLHSRPRGLALNPIPWTLALSYTLACLAL